MFYGQPIFIGSVIIIAGGNFGQKVPIGRGIGRGVKKTAQKSLMILPGFAYPAPVEPASLAEDLGCVGQIRTQII